VVRSLKTWLTTGRERHRNVLTPLASYLQGSYYIHGGIKATLRMSVDIKITCFLAYVKLSAICRSLYVIAYTRIYRHELKSQTD
jgi:hypothetical protein